MEKTISYKGVQYIARRRTNLNKQDISYFKLIYTLFYEGLADDLGQSAGRVASALLEFAYISGLVTGGVALLNRNDAPEIIQEKCRQWLVDGDLAELSDTLIALVNDVNPQNPDIALAPEALPKEADPKVLRAAKPSKKRRVNVG